MRDGKAAAAGFVAFSHLRQFGRRSGRCAAQSGRLKKRIRRFSDGLYRKVSGSGCG
ncbi:outer membrane protein 8 [Neisseria bacilliformis ATCC BAA-1200]|uniref:Outer membrane protein 8 n=1 Tax=Neisseria bacilliformis ATCC BAA-1200 TaxID=888742 RepID=F2B8R6_9NEIS|nr:outer membrane protein 8 [Neisseria bacilliformis ATCC BAA-1200]